VTEANDLKGVIDVAALMDQAMPQWRLHREELNREPLGCVTWEY